jgi:hypothetical protein
MQGEKKKKMELGIKNRNDKAASRGSNAENGSRLQQRYGVKVMKMGVSTARCILHWKGLSCQIVLTPFGCFVFFIVWTRQKVDEKAKDIINTVSICPIEVKVADICG